MARGTVSRDGVGIVVPTARLDGGPVDAAALRATLQSLCDQTDDDLEILLVHGAAVGPIDPGVDDPRVRTVPSDTLDPVGLLEAGLMRVSTRWVRFLSAGDTLAPRVLGAEALALADTPDVSVVFDPVEVVGGGGSIEQVSSVPDTGGFSAGALLPSLVAGNPWPLAAARIEREALHAVGAFDRTLGGYVAHDLWWRLLAGRAALVLNAEPVRVRSRNPSSGDTPMHVRTLLRHLRGDVLEATVRALGGGPPDSAAQGIARAELARRVQSLGRPELRPLVWRLVREARGAGAYFPADEPFQELAGLAPELARSDGWFPAAPAERPAVDRHASARPSFPPRVCVALGTDDAGSRLTSVVADLDAKALGARGLEIVLLHSGVEAPPVADGVAVEILRHEGSVSEIEGVLERRGVTLLVAPDTHPAGSVANAAGLATRSEWPAGDCDTVARTFLRESSAASVARRSATDSTVRRAARRSGQARDEATLLALGRALAAGSARVGESLDHDLTGRLGEARRHAEGARRAALTVDRDARRALDKLRIGRRIRETLGSRSPNGARAPAVLSLDEARAQRFLEQAASKGPHRLWVVYTTDPYSETQGQRSTWIVRELLARGDSVVFFYWRWELSEPIVASAHEGLLSVPIDQFFRLQRPLMDLAAPGLEKLFLIEFPDAYLYEQIDFANAHGFTTIYDCVDDWEEFARVGQAHWYDVGVERHLVRHADVVVATHPVLARRLEAMGRPEGSIPVVPNGVSLDSLEGAPARARSGPPVIGYFGHLTPAWFDWELIAETARAHPEWTFDIIGHGAPDALDLPANVSVPGPVPHEALEERTRAWHVGIVPFRPGRLTQAVDPIKLYEYLALGLPAVVVDMPHLAGTPGVEVAERAGFAGALERALSRPFEVDAASEFARGSRWSVRTDALCEAARSASRSDLLKVL